ncbi:hypothetical protein Bca52824_064928 [Brassica carinata]|uniref:Uncharacterized protein n=1 Tax=Brassica carinata TaxID=52824 RepID=A0A8X7QIS3_BRACI|nr:hypothetical protein Bca52824_064928 [Brassica carinata]
MSTAEAIWKNLLSRFKQDDAPRYKNYVELPVCTCGHCECNAAMLWERLQQQSHVTKFLMGLNDAYEQTRRHILMLKPIPTIDEVFNMVSQDERQKNLKHAVPMESPSVNRTSHASQGAQGSQNYYLQTTLANDVTSPAHTLDLSKFSSEQVQSLISQLLLLMLVSL